ncbi:hypothetical protein Nepgr_001551 [Nepenthes gracilis]|uniref:Uncharacterized GPI-anchored protein At5g19230-like domain-containing protein n=1 Tax=Nepenthes gracilis TaxID=150966 RepID=A0AAD3P5D4_NEPGR|nr:hypothetical protein Nepgr_001551 [Nepenthes gracilis]
MIVCADDVEDHLLQGLNSHRTSANLPALVKHKNAGCLADEFADELEDRPCTPASAASVVPGSGSQQFSDYPELLRKCGINASTTAQGVILPVCVPDLVPTLLLTNYTHTSYARYINNSKFTGAGIGSEDDWVVVVLATSTPGGSFASAAAAVPVAYKAVNYFLPMLFGFFLVH